MYLQADLRDAIVCSCSKQRRNKCSGTSLASKLDKNKLPKPGGKEEKVMNALSMAQYTKYSFRKLENSTKSPLIIPTPNL